MHRNLQVGKTTLTDIGALTARPHIIVVVHIDIEDHLFLHRYESLFVTCVVTVGRNIINGSNIDFVGDLVDQRLPKMLSILEAKVTTVDIVGQGEAKLTLVEVRRVSAVIEAHQ